MAYSSKTIFDVFDALIVIRDRATKNWLHVQYDNSTNKTIPLSFFSPFYTYLGTPQTNTHKGFLVTEYTPKTGEQCYRVGSNELLETINPFLLEKMKDPEFIHIDKSSQDQYILKFLQKLKKN